MPKNNTYLTKKDISNVGYLIDFYYETISGVDKEFMDSNSDFHKELNNLKDKIYKRNDYGKKEINKALDIANKLKAEGKI